MQQGKKIGAVDRKITDLTHVDRIADFLKKLQFLKAISKRESRLVCIEKLAG